MLRAKALTHLCTESSQIILRRAVSALASRAAGCKATPRSRLLHRRPQAAPGSMPPPAVAPALAGCEPASLWGFFSELSAIPRPSKHEGRVLDWLKAFAEARGLEWRQDAAGNLVIARPGSGGGEGAPPVIVQGHVDMVTEKDAASAHDFMADGIRLVRDGDWLKADGTTLGADNGVGVAAALALLDAPAGTPLPPLEALFTVDEETGLTGAFGLDGSLLKGRVLVNLDTEEHGEVYVGCSGGGDSRITLRAAREAPPAGGVPLRLAVRGLKGGHSGLNIHEGRGNAVQMAATCVDAALAAAPGARLATLAGGDKRNAIPREASATLVVPPGGETAARRAVEACAAALRAEFGQLEGALEVELAAAAEGPVTAVLADADAQRLLSLLLALPHGVIKMSHAVEGLVETSSNVASVKPQPVGGDPAEAAVFVVGCSTRSSLMPALERTRGAIRRLAALAECSVEQDTAYPGWAPAPDADIVRVARAAIAEVTGEEPAVKAIHAGLECGIISERIGGGVQAVSFGPTIRGAHSPDERCLIPTVEPFWRATLKVMEVLAARRA